MRSPSHQNLAAADDEADVPAMKGWRRELFGDKALALKHGELSLAIQRSRVVAVERRDLGVREHEPVPVARPALAVLARLGHEHPRRRDLLEQAERLRHALANQVTITVTRQAGATVLTVDDDGVGFEPRKLLEDGDRSCVGVKTLVDDVRLAGADLRLRTAPGAGTHWLLWVPA